MNRIGISGPHSSGFYILFCLCLRRGLPVLEASVLLPQSSQGFSTPISNPGQSVWATCSTCASCQPTVVIALGGSPAPPSWVVRKWPWDTVFSRNTDVMPFVHGPRLSSRVFLWDGGISFFFFFLTENHCQITFLSREEVDLRTMTDISGN